MERLEAAKRSNAGGLCSPHAPGKWLCSSHTPRNGLCSLSYAEGVAFVLLKCVYLLVVVSCLLL